MPCSFKRALEDLTREKAVGPSPTFSVLDLFSAIETVGTRPIGRNKLAEELEVGDGVVRTILRRLTDAELIETSKAGCSLTDKGMRLWKECSRILQKVRITENELTPTEHSFAVLIKSGGNKVKSGIEQRDAAILIGTKSVTTIVFRNSRLIIPSVSENIAKDFPNAARQIVRLFGPEEGDAVVISSAENSKKAEYSALAAAWTLLD
jgi:predicted transcriptional regulator